MFCTSCGKQLKGHESFCTYCGKNVNPSGSPIPAQPIPAQPIPAQPLSSQPQPAQPITTQPLPAQPLPAQPIPGAAVPGQPGQPIPAQPLYGAAMPGQPIPAHPAPENHLRRQIKRVSRNRIILFCILTLWFFPMFVLFFFVTLSSIFGTGFADSSSYGVSESIAGLMIFGVPGVLVIIKLIQAVIGNLDYTKSSAYKKLGNFAGLSPDEFNSLRSRNMSSALLFSHRRLTATEHWLLIHSSFSLRIFPAAKLAWIYMKEHTTVEQKTYREISSNTYAVFEFLDGSRRSIHASSQICKEILTGVAESYPHLLVGYTDENKSLYNTAMNTSLSTLLKRGQGMDNI